MPSFKRSSRQISEISGIWPPSTIQRVCIPIPFYKSTSIPTIFIKTFDIAFSGKSDRAYREGGANENVFPQKKVQCASSVDELKCSQGEFTNICWTDPKIEQANDSCDPHITNVWLCGVNTCWTKLLCQYCNLFYLFDFVTLPLFRFFLLLSFVLNFLTL